MGNNIRTSKLPGQEIALDSGDVCDTVGHQHIAAVKRIVGETDSLGSESICFCQPCWDAYKAAPEDIVGVCDRCKTDNVTLVNKRDWEEGSSGPVYQVCSNCRDAMNQSERDACDDHSDDDGDWEEDVFDCSEPPGDPDVIEVRPWTAEDDDRVD